MANNLSTQDEQLFENIRELITESRQRISKTINSEMVKDYWQIGFMIVEHEQQGQSRAEYGKASIKALSQSLTEVFGKGFSTRNLRNMRSFYMTFPNWQTLSANLSWSHYNRLISVESEQARLWYMNEAADQNWSVRALDRQIGTLYYERLLSSKEKQPVLDEADIKTKPLKFPTKNYLREPYIFDFLDLPDGILQESELEQALVENLQSFLLELDLYQVIPN